jgi:hypothetical protein
VANGRTCDLVFPKDNNDMEIATSDLLLETTPKELLERALNRFVVDEGICL